MNGLGHPTGSFEANTIGETTGPKHARLLRELNGIHEAVAEGDDYRIKKAKTTVPALLRDFAATESQSHVNQPWLIAKMLAGYHVALGEYPEAIRYEMEGYQHALAEPDTNEGVCKRRSVSASNLSDQLRRIGQISESLSWGRLSIELWPSNMVNHLVLALAVYQAGHKLEADKILQKLVEFADFDSGTDILANCMAFEAELHEMDDIASVQQLVTKLAVR